ncbi:MAG: pyruvate carboxyltransferase [Proteobacteria bacterium]|nr:pyruvate carboxyltransferase [Pseudomonadota bacterium]MBU1714193.1 pyruvate carboxyltransferase [Pseudomonadota bacterium]
MKGLIDSTLREGGQMAGVSFSLDDKKRIFTNLVQIGIEEIEIGVATSYDPDLVKLINFCRVMSPETRIALWSPCRTENINFATQLKADVLSLSIPTSEILIKKKLRRDTTWVLRTLQRSIKLAQKNGINFISLGLEDATRAEPGFLKELILTASSSGALRIRLADTIGIASPQDIIELMRVVRLYYHGDIGVHMHNDFGMATANSISALDAGAEYADVTVLGIGERAGNAKLEEIVGFLSFRNGRPYKTTALKPLAELMAHLIGRETSLTQPVIGAHIFHCESGLHLQGLRKDTSTYEPFSPEKVGAKRQLLYGTKIGKREIKDSLEPMGINLPVDQLSNLAGEIHQIASQLNRPLLQKEFNYLLTSIHDNHFL